MKNSHRWSAEKRAKYNLTIRKRKEKKENKHLEAVVNEFDKGNLDCKFCDKTFDTPHGARVHEHYCSENPNNKSKISKEKKANGSIKHGTSKENSALTYEIQVAYTVGRVEELIRNIAESNQLSFSALADRVVKGISALNDR